MSHFFVCRLVSMDLSKRTGEEFTNPAKGRYDVGRIDLRGKKLNRYALQPPEAKEFILARRQALLVAALTDDAPPLTLASPAATAPPAWSAATGACAPEPAPDDAATPDQTITADETVSTDQAGTAGEATMSQHANSDDAGTPDCGSSAPTPAPATMDAGKVAERRPRRAMPPILEIVDGAVVNDGSDPPTRALPRPRRWPRWPFHR
ncbi:hypothetical protein [Candidatus Frankia alpina]|uniref:hypothetical protein n=1 Tax=Candidatus Frankia alpina TaxID=2699483 RepID=UPI001F2EF4FA|nr:hypothetical protein [Candidatus Frankia alpina]